MPGHEPMDLRFRYSTWDLVLLLAPSVNGKPILLPVLLVMALLIAGILCLHRFREDPIAWPVFFGGMLCPLTLLAVAGLLLVNTLLAVRAQAELIGKEVVV